MELWLDFLGRLESSTQGALTDMAQTLLGDVPASCSSAVEEAMEPAYFLGSDKRMRFDSMPNAHIAFAFKAPAAGSKDSLAIMMVEALLGEICLFRSGLLCYFHIYTLCDEYVNISQFFVVV